MKLYNLDHSPYASRVRMQIRKKSLPIDIVPPPIPMRTPEFNERFPMGKLPVLELDGGEQVAESWTIMEYLEDVFADAPLRPQDPMAKAQMGMIARCADTHLGPGGLFPLFAKLMVPGGTEGQDALVAALLNELARLERLLVSLPDFSARPLHLGDIALVPHMGYVLAIAPMFGLENPLQDFPALSRWWLWVQSDEAIAVTTQEMQDGFKAFINAKK